jgi:MerR family transcriptional regulator, copper efflux regulator
MRARSLPKPEMAEARQQGLRNISEAAAASGVSAKSIRHYEASGLLPASARSAANYRLYSQSDIHTLRFIKSARTLGFTLPDIGKLLQLWQNQKRSSRDVKALAQHHMGELDKRLVEIQRMRDTLKHLVECCQGDQRPDCPILDILAAPSEDKHCC